MVTFVRRNAIIIQIVAKPDGTVVINGNNMKPTDAQALPEAPVSGERPATITLVPYGCTKFRISMFPVTPRAWGKGSP